MNRGRLQALVDELQPWHYCHQFPHGVVTGTSKPDYLEKLDLMGRAGAWPELAYPRVLDLGSNSGLVPMWFADNTFSKVIAAEFLDNTFAQLNLAVEVKGYRGKVLPWLKDIREGDYGENEYDLITFLGTLHHCGAPYHSTIFSSCLAALKPGANVVVQTRPDMLVPQKLRSAGFVGIHKLEGYEQQDRFAWIATKPKK